MAKSNKIMIQVCLCGAGTKKAQAPTVPSRNAPDT